MSHDNLNAPSASFLLRVEMLESCTNIDTQRQTGPKSNMQPIEKPSKQKLAAKRQTISHGEQIRNTGNRHRNAG